MSPGPLSRAHPNLLVQPRPPPSPPPPPLPPALAPPSRATTRLLPQQALLFHRGLKVEVDDLIRLEALRPLEEHVPLQLIELDESLSDGLGVCFDAVACVCRTKGVSKFATTNVGKQKPLSVSFI